MQFSRCRSLLAGYEDRIAGVDACTREEGPLGRRYNTNIIIYGVSRHQRKVLPATLSCSAVSAAAVPFSLARQPFPGRRGGSLPPYYLRTPYVTTLKQLGLTRPKLIAGEHRREIRESRRTTLDFHWRI